MSKAAAGIVVALILVIGGMYAYSMMPKTGAGEVATLPIEFSAIDKLAGGQDATTSKVAIYRMVDGQLSLQETVTINAAGVESTLDYTTGEQLYLKLYDDTDTSVCTQYMVFTVPYASASNIYNGKFHVDLFFVDRGDSTKDIRVDFANGTAISASSTLDVTDEGWDSNYAYFDFAIRNLDDDTGYVNTYNFLRDYGNYHYFFISVSGTGWDSVNILGNVESFTIGTTKYWAIKLTDDDITRDLQANGEYDPDGIWTRRFTFDLTGFESGDSVTLTYGYVWYADWDHFKSSGSWGVDASQTTESITIQY